MRFFKRLNFLRVKTRFDAQKITIIQFRNGQKIDSVWGTNRVTWSELEDLCGRSTALSSPFSRNRNWKTEIQMLAIGEFVMTYLFNDKLLRIVSQYEYVFPKSSRCSKKKEVINDFWWRSSESLKITKKLLLHNCLSSFLQPCLLCKFEVTVHAENCTQSGSETQLFFAFFALRKLICMYHK